MPELAREAALWPSEVGQHVGRGVAKASLHVRATEGAQKCRVFSEQEYLIPEERTSEPRLKRRCCASGWWLGARMLKCLTDLTFEAFLAPPSEHHLTPTAS